MVSFVGKPPREVTFRSPEEQGAEPWGDDEIMAEIRATRWKLMEEREAASCVVREESPEK